MRRTDKCDHALALALGEPVSASLFCIARGSFWRLLLSPGTLVGAVASGVTGIDALGDMAEIAIDKGADVFAARKEKQAEQAEKREGEYRGEKLARLKRNQYLYLAATPSKFAIYRPKGFWGTKLGKPLLVAPRSAIAGCDLSGGHVWRALTSYPTYTWDLTVRMVDGRKFRFGIHVGHKKLARKLAAALNDHASQEREAAPQPPTGAVVSLTPQAPAGSVS